MTLQLQKAIRQLALTTSQQFGHRHLTVVVTDSCPNRPEKTKGPHVPLPKSLRVLPLKDLHKKGVTIGQTHHEKRSQFEQPIHVHKGMAKVHLGFARPVDQGHKDLLF